MQEVAYETVRCPKIQITGFLASQQTTKWCAFRVEIVVVKRRGKGCRRRRAMQGAQKKGEFRER